MNASRETSRKPTRLQGFDYSTAAFYLITICAEGRKHLFGDVQEAECQMNEAGHLISEIWLKLPERVSAIQTLDYVVMPNHFHGILRLLPEIELGSTGATDLSSAVGAFKSLTTLEYIRAVRAGRLPRFDGKVWQRSFHDHVIRSDEDMQRVQEYIANNPLCWHLDMENELASGRNDFYGWLGL